MISEQEKKVLTGALVRLTKVLDELIEQKNYENKEILEMIKGILKQQAQMFDEIRELKAKMN